MSKKDIILSPVKDLTDLTSFDKIVINNGLSLKGDFVNKESVALTNAMVLEIKEGDIPYAKVVLNNHPEWDNKKEINITNDFIKNADIYVLKEHVEDVLTEKGYKALYYTFKRKNRKLEKALIKQKAYAKKGRIEPGVAPKKKEKEEPDELDSFIGSEIMELPRFGSFVINFHITGKREIEARIFKAGTCKVIAKGVAKCHKNDKYNSQIGMEISATRAILELYKEIY